MGVVLLESKDLKKSGAYSLPELQQRNLIMKITLRKELYSRRARLFFPKSLAVGGDGWNRKFAMIVNIL